MDGWIVIVFVVFFLYVGPQVSSLYGDANGDLILMKDYSMVPDFVWHLLTSNNVP